MLIKADIKALEWVCACFLSQDPTGMREIIENVDVHSVNQRDLVLPNRLIAKKYLFRTIYRGPAWAFANDAEFSHVSTSVDYWQEREDRFYEKYNGLRRKQNEWIEEVWATGQLSSVTGRIYRPTQYNKNGLLVYKDTDIANYPVQGLGAELLTLLRIRIFHRIVTVGGVHALNNTVHDDIEADVPDEETKKFVCLVLQEEVNRLPLTFEEHYFVKFNLPIRVEISIGNNLKDMQILA
jgi:DNA polymerase I-like protein with 3'-5' exonuclease and polymerase domains